MKKLLLILSFSLLSQMGFATNISLVCDNVLLCDASDTGCCNPAQQQQSNTPKAGYDNGHKWVDLGLPSGTLWATCNVGASTPSEIGNYYSWGETRPKTTYTWENYLFRTSGDSKENVRFSKYNTRSADGTVDNITQLNLRDDAAHINWGGNWRIPTRTQWEELMQYCDWYWTGSAYELVGPNGQSIILPAAGFMYKDDLRDVGGDGVYWSSTLATDEPTCAIGTLFSAYCTDVTFRFVGLPVRAVTE